MLQRIHIQPLTLGMYRREFCGPWMEHSLWHARCLLQEPKDLARIPATSLRECGIDTSKGGGRGTGHHRGIARGGWRTDRDRFQPPAGGAISVMDLRSGRTEQVW